jgi:predicted enzyme related to lactoylglutathione lyase
MPNPVVHFEIPADDVARARSFYEKTFGWTIKQFPMPPGGPEYYGVTTRKKGEDGIDGGLMKRNMPGQPFANYVSVKSIEDFNDKIQANGGVIVMPKQEIAPMPKAAAKKKAPAKKAKAAKRAKKKRK